MITQQQGTTMQKLRRQDLFSLEQYAKQRESFRTQVLAHKKHRQILLGDHITLYFEDRLTMQYQVQEMLRVERIFEEDGILDELNAYNPLIPDGHNLKATMMIEYENVDERRQALAKLMGVEDKIWLQVAGHDKVYAVADEDLQRDTADKTSAVHFLRFEFSPSMIRDFKSGAALSAGVMHPQYPTIDSVLADETCASLRRDFN